MTTTRTSTSRQTKTLSKANGSDKEGGKVSSPKAFPIPESRSLFVICSLSSVWCMVSLGLVGVSIRSEMDVLVAQLADVSPLSNVSWVLLSINLL